MIEQKSLAGSFTRPASMTLNRMATAPCSWRSRRVGPRRCKYAIAVLREAVESGGTHRHQRLLRTSCDQSAGQAGAPSLCQGSRDRHQVGVRRGSDILASRSSRQEL